MIAACARAREFEHTRRVTQSPSQLTYAAHTGTRAPGQTDTATSPRAAQTARHAASSLCALFLPLWQPQNHAALFSHALTGAPHAFPRDAWAGAASADKGACSYTKAATRRAAASSATRRWALDAAVRLAMSSAAAAAAAAGGAHTGPSRRSAASRLDGHI